jgi:exosortase/archaeosortase family protein
MLWTGLFLAASLACWQRLETHQAFRLLQRASLTIFAANVLRAAALFCIEAKLWPSPSWAHEGVGLVLFGAAARAIYLASESSVQRKTPAHMTA